MRETTYLVIAAELVVFHVVLQVEIEIILLNNLCTYDLYSPMHNVLDVCISIARASRRGLVPGNRVFFGPCEMASSR